MSVHDLNNQPVSTSATDDSTNDYNTNTTEDDDMTRQSNKRTYDDAHHNTENTDDQKYAELPTDSTNKQDMPDQSTNSDTQAAATSQSSRSPEASISTVPLARKLSDYHLQHASQQPLSPTARSEASGAALTNDSDMLTSDETAADEPSTALIVPPVLPPSPLLRDESIATQYALSHDNFGTALYFGTGLFGLSAGSNIDESYGGGGGAQSSDSDIDMVVVSTQNSDTNVNQPTRIPMFKTTDIKQIVFGASHGIALTATGQAFAWGSNTNGQLGIGSKSEATQFEPVPITALSDKYIKQVIAGYNQTAFLTSQNELYVCGCNTSGQLGLNSSKTKAADWSYDDAIVPTLVKSLQKVHVVAVALGDRHTAVLSDMGTVFVCGDASTGALGLPINGKWTEQQPLLACFTAISTLSPGVVVDIAAGETHTLALLNTGVVYSFGNNKRGQLGHGDNKVHHQPQRIAALAGQHIVNVYAGATFSMFLTSTGELYACGDGRHGQLGLGNTETYYLPQLVDALNDHVVLHVAAGYTHSVAVTNENLVFTFGSNDANQCGSGYDGELVKPTLLQHRRVDNRPILHIAAGSDTSAVITGNPIKRNNEDANIPLRMPAVPTQIARFDTDVLLRMLQSANINNDYGVVYTYIHKVFSTAQYVNNSFMSLDLTQQYGGIDSDAAEEAFKHILNESVRQPKIYQVLSSAIQKLVSNMTQRLQSDAIILDQSAFRCLCIVLQCPIMMSNSPSDIALVSDLCIVIRRTNATFKQVLKAWFATYSPQLFQTRLVRMLVMFLTRRLSQLVESSADRQPLQRVTEEVVAAVELLSILKAASRTHTPRLANETLFHVDKLEQYVDLGNDFNIWMHTPPATGTNKVPFTFCRYSFLLTPLTKSALMRMESAFHQQQSAFYSYILGQQPVTVFKIRRSSILDDTIAAINSYTQDDLRRPLEIKFIGTDGVEEEGVDRGGLSREYFELIARELVKPEYELFTYNNEQRTLWYNTDTPDYSKSDLYYIAGMVFGLALYNGIQCSVNFVPTVYRQLLNLPLSIDDLQSFDSTLAKSLADMQHMTAEEVESLCLTYAVTAPNHKHINTAAPPVVDAPSSTITEVVHEPTQQQAQDDITTVELVPNGNDTAVVKSNLDDYIAKYVQYILTDSVKVQAQQFVRGFRSVCQGKAVKLFTSKDLEQIITGGNSNLNFDELEQTARYDGGYNKDHETIKRFWHIFHHRLTADQRREFLVFATGSARSPLGGLKELRLVIQRAGPDSEQLPTGHTCFNMLLLPEYADEDKMYKKLTLALKHGQTGFGLQ